MNANESNGLDKVLGGLVLGLVGLFFYKSGRKDGYKDGRTAGRIEGATDLMSRVYDRLTKKEDESEEGDS